MIRKPQRLTVQREIAALAMQAINPNAKKVEEKPAPKKPEMQMAAHVDNARSKTERALADEARAGRLVPEPVRWTDPARRGG